MHFDFHDRSFLRKRVSHVCQVPTSLGFDRRQRGTAWDRLGVLRGRRVLVFLDISSSKPRKLPSSAPIEAVTVIDIVRYLLYDPAWSEAMMALCHSS